VNEGIAMLIIGRFLYVEVKSDLSNSMNHKRPITNWAQNRQKGWGCLLQYK